MKAADRLVLLVITGRNVNEKWDNLFPSYCFNLVRNHNFVGVTDQVSVYRMQWSYKSTRLESCLNFNVCFAVMFSLKINCETCWPMTV